MIAEPLADRGCLDSITATIADLVEQGDPSLTAIAERFGTTRELATWIRSLPQRDDLGAVGDGPKVDACEPPQRLRIAPPDPNCVERAALYLGAADLIDPVPTRALTTIDVPGGRHTLPVEDDAPVVLDPRISRNAARAGLFHAVRRRNGSTPVALSPTQAVQWISLLASEPAACFRGGLDRVRAGHKAMLALLVGRPIEATAIGDVAFTLALAFHEAHLYGDVGPRIVGTTAVALDRIDAENGGAPARNAGPELRVGRYRVRPDYDVLRRLGHVGGRLGYRVGVATLREKLSELGLSGPMVADLERSLNREGLSLGALAQSPPMPGSLGAITPDALAGRWLAQRL